MSNNRYRVKVRETGNPTAEHPSGKTYWTDIGIAFANDNGSFKIRLSALPMNGEAYLFPMEQNTGDGLGGSGASHNAPHYQQAQKIEF